MALSSTISRPQTKTGGEADVAAWRPSALPGDRTIPADLVEDDFLIPLVDVARHLNAYADEVARAHGITRAQLIIIARLERQPELSQDELAAVAEVAPKTIAFLIDSLETLGMLKRCSDPERRTSVQLTPAAAPLLRDINHLRANLYSLATKGIEPALLKKMVFGLRRMEALRAEKPPRHLTAGSLAGRWLRKEPNCSAHSSAWKIPRCPYPPGSTIS